MGFDPDTVYQPTLFQLSEGDTLLLFTDGISEAHNVTGKEWGERALKKTFAGAGMRPLTQIKSEIVTSIGNHIQGTTQGDDITFVLIKWNGKVAKVIQSSGRKIDDYYAKMGNIARPTTVSFMTPKTEKTLSKEDEASNDQGKKNTKPKAA